MSWNWDQLSSQGNYVIKILQSCSKKPILELFQINQAEHYNYAKHPAADRKELKATWMVNCIQTNKCWCVQLITLRANMHYIDVFLKSKSNPPLPCCIRDGALSQSPHESPFLIIYSHMYHICQTYLTIKKF